MTATELPADPLPGPDGEHDGSHAASAAGAQRRRHTVAWSCAAVAVVVAVFVAILAASGPATQVNAQSPLIGKAFPPISGPNLMAGTGPSQPPSVDLVAAPGHWLLVNFAASWCIPCQREMPQLLLFAQRHAASGDAQIVTVEYQEGDQASLAGFFTSRHADWPVLDDNGAKVAYGVTGIPESYLIDPQGTVVAKLINGVVADQLDAIIAPFPGQSRAPQPRGP